LPPNTKALSARIVIVAYNSAECLQDCLSALEMQTQNDFEVIIINNDCPQNSTSNLSMPRDNFHIIDVGHNLGFAAGCNLGAKDAKTNWIITLNPDTIVKENWFEMLSLAWKQSPATQSWASLQIMDQDRSKLDGFGDVFSIFGLAWRGGYAQPIETAPKDDKHIFAACGAVAAYKRDVFEKLGGFDPNYFCYLEDIDLALRLHMFGGSVKIASSAIVYHKGGASSAKTPKFSLFQTYKNNLYLIVKNMPLPILFLCLPAYLMIQVWVLLRSSNKGLNTVRLLGLWASLKLMPEALKMRQKRQVQPQATSDLWRKLNKSYFSLKHQKIHTYDNIHKP